MDTTPQVPPIEQGELGHSFDDQPGWPRAIGIVSIVWASIGLVCGTLGVASLVLMGWLTSFAEEQLGPYPEEMRPPPIMMILGGLGLLWTFALLTAGIMTVRRNPSGRQMHLVWAVVAIILGGVSMYIQFDWQSEVRAWAEAHRDNGWAKQQLGTGQNIGQMIGLVIGVLMQFGWPIFCLIWFGMVKTRPSDWGTRAEAPVA